MLLLPDVDTLDATLALLDDRYGEALEASDVEGAITAQLAYHRVAALRATVAQLTPYDRESFAFATN